MSNQISIEFLAQSTGIALRRWNAKLSYLACRELVDRKIISGKAMLGTYREPNLDPSDNELLGYTIKHTNYGWIVTDNGLIFDPCNCVAGSDRPVPLITSQNESYYAAIDPLTAEIEDIPDHYESDEIFQLKPGLHREVFSQILDYFIGIKGLTMLEAAVIANQNFDRLQPYNKLVYEYLVDQKLSKLIPLNNIKKSHPHLARKSPGHFYMTE